MRRAVLWKRPVKARGRVLRESHCGRYTIVTVSMANMSGRAGHFTVKAYELRRPDGTRIGKAQDQLYQALDLAEWDNDPNWDPER